MNKTKQLKKLNKAVKKLTKGGNIVIIRHGYEWVQIAGHFRIDPIKDTLIVENSY